MKLNFFKFQDGKVLWLPEYPEKPNENDFQGLVNGKAFFDEAMFEYSMKIKESLASAIEVAPEDREKVKSEIWWTNIWTLEEDKKHGNKVTLDPIINAWQPENGKVYSAECEMKTHYEEIVRGQWVSSSKGIFELVSRSKQPDEVRRFAHIKPKDEIPAANSQDMKEGLK